MWRECSNDPMFAVLCALLLSDTLTAQIRRTFPPEVKTSRDPATKATRGMLRIQGAARRCAATSVKRSRGSARWNGLVTGVDAIPAVP